MIYFSHRSIAAFLFATFYRHASKQEATFPLTLSLLMNALYSSGGLLPVCFWWMRACAGNRFIHNLQDWFSEHQHAAFSVTFKCYFCFRAALTFRSAACVAGEVPSQHTLCSLTALQELLLISTLHCTLLSFTKPILCDLVSDSDARLMGADKPRSLRSKGSFSLAYFVPDFWPSLVDSNLRDLK